MPELVVATRSAPKLREIAAILPEIAGLTLRDLDSAGLFAKPEEEGIEAFATFRENALAKARYFARCSGRMVLADDSGLCVDALDGAPGVHSKRFSGRLDLEGEALDRANNELLLRSLEGVPLQRRTARYVCAVALVEPEGREATFEGRCEGLILPSAYGEKGFGYDPLFLLPAAEATFGEVDGALKNRVSHRARAVRAAAGELSRWLTPGRGQKTGGSAPR